MNKGDIVSYPKHSLPKWLGNMNEGTAYGVVFSPDDDGIEFFEYVGGHQGGKDILKDGHCWFCIHERVTVIEEA